MTIQGTANEADVSLVGQTFTVGLPSSITTNVTGNVTGDLTGNVSGATTIAGTTVNATTINATTTNSALVGNVTGNVSGDLTGNVTATSVLADGVTGTTQSLGDNSTKVATTAYVDSTVTAQDLDISDGTTSSSVDLDSETLTIQGTTNETEVSLTGQTYTVGLPADVTLSNSLMVGGTTTIDQTSVTATFLNGSGVAISEMPTVCYEWEDAVSAPYFNLSNGANNFIPWNNTRENYPASTEYYELFNSGTSTGGDCARVQIKTAGLYLFQVGIHLYDLFSNVDVLVKLMQSANQTGFFPSPVTQGLMCDMKFAEVTADQMLVGSKILNVTANNYFTIAVEPSANSPYPSDANDGRTYFQITKLH